MLHLIHRMSKKQTRWQDFKIICLKLEKNVTSRDFPQNLKVLMTQHLMTHPQSLILCGPAVVSLLREGGGGGWEGGGPTGVICCHAVGTRSCCPGLDQACCRQMKNHKSSKSSLQISKLFECLQQNLKSKVDTSIIPVYKDDPRPHRSKEAI